jgi:hypothetical protein
LGGIALFGELARRRVTTADVAGQLGRVDQSSLVPAASMLAAWGAAAATVNLASMLVGEGIVARGRPATTLGIGGTLGAGAFTVVMVATTPGGAT